MALLSAVAVLAFVTQSALSLSKQYAIKPQLSDFDSLGAWFEGVVDIDDDLHIDPSQVKSKDSKIGIVGAGISGLMSALLFDSVGLHNWEILESSDRVGGRIKTEYVKGTSPDQYQYQEMGAMRFPQYWQSDDDEMLPIKDQHLINQLADTLNALNSGVGEYFIKFIPWIEEMENSHRDSNDRRLPDGSIPRLKDIEDSERLTDPITNHEVYDNHQISETARQADQEYADVITQNGTIGRLVADNIFYAHKKMIDEGLDETNQYHLIKELGYNLTTFEEANNYDGDGIWYNVFINSAYSNAVNWTTVDKGVSRLPEAFKPLTQNSIHYHSRVDTIKLEHDGRVTLQWNDEAMNHRTSDTYDYAIISAPFSVVRGWHLPAFDSPLISRAIQEVGYGTACKTALQFSNRFWEHGSRPIRGGCDSTDAFYGVNTICYPSYKVGDDGPAVVLTSYVQGDAGVRLVSWPQEKLIKQVLASMARLYGDAVYEAHTGESMYKCWLTDENAAGAWVNPREGQHTLFIPEYHKVHNGVVFAGEHTSITHAWISSAAMSAVRGVVQTLLDMGLIKEAKEVTREWMWRWLDPL